jgi:2,3-bisphosphoglycerate-dependent phosphoglycerate mutase
VTASAWPEPTRLFVLRHGQTAWNAGGRLQGHLDIPLDDTGRRQAAQAAQALAGETLAVVYSSDLQRARDTAQPLATATAAPLVTDVRLRERSFGSFEGLTYDEVERQWPDDALRWRRREPAFRPGGGESLSDFYQRSVDTVLALAAAHAGQAIAVVAHGGVLDCLYRAATGIDLSAPRTWLVGNATINRLLYTGERLQMVGWSDTGHLEGDALA